MIMKALRWITVVAILLVLFAVGVTVMFTRSQPSEDELSLAHTLVSVAQKLATNKDQQVLYEASRSAVAINVYGVSESGEQTKILEALRAASSDRDHTVKVRVHFFPVREYDITIQPGGKRVSRLKKVPPMREVELN